MAQPEQEEANLRVIQRGGGEARQALYECAERACARNGLDGLHDWV